MNKSGGAEGVWGERLPPRLGGIPKEGPGGWVPPGENSRPPGDNTDHALARDLAAEAGRLLLERRAGGGEPDLLRKAGDRLSHEFLTAALAERRPGDVVLSEEGADDPARLTASRVWIVDPLDGTREFGEAGRVDWAVHVALWERTGGGELTAGAVALPAQDQVLSTATPPEPLPPAAAGARVRIVVSRTRPPRLVQNISDLIDAELVPLGSAGAKVAAVVCGEADAYVHAGGFYEWDTAAPVAVARAAGCHASRVDGSPLAYNQANLKMPDILVCRPALAGTLLQAIREVTNAP
jgi:3'(2'), 5'-bisphosphate nucleotidase